MLRSTYFCAVINLSFFDVLKVRQGLTLVFLSGAVLTLFPVPGTAFAGWAANAQWVALAYLFLGLFFLIINRFRLMFVCFGCSAAISFYYQETAQKKEQLPAAPASSLRTNEAEQDAYVFRF